MPHLDPEMFNPFEIIVGTYEQYLLGYKVRNVVNEYKLEKSFATHNHLASIRSVASGKHYLASAGADDAVYLYDMHYRRESGKLTHHNDTINCITFTPEASHLFTCSKDGSIALIRCGNWQMEKHWPQAHKGSPVNTVAVHPTGKLALSTGMDGVLRTWNLVKGRQAYAINLVPRLKYDAKNVTIIKWSPNGDKYLIAVSQKIDIYTVEIAGIYREFAFDLKIICVEFLNDDLIAIGFENGQIRFFDLRTSERTLETRAHDIRVKCIAHMNDLLVSASSSGEIKLWKYKKYSLDMLQTVNCGARITCLSLALPCKNLTEQNSEDKSEEIRKEVKKGANIRLKQEVIIEDEGECEVTNRKIKISKKKCKRKRVVEDAESNVHNQKKKKASKLKVADSSKKKRDRSLEKEDDTCKPKKKTKKMVLKVNEANISSKKRKLNSTTSRDTLPTKKLKGNSIVPTIRKKHKAEKSTTTNVKDAPPRKKKEVNSPEEIVPKKRKKKDKK